MTRNFERVGLKIVNSTAPWSCKIFVLLFMSRHKEIIHSLVHFLQTAQFFTNAPSHIPPVSFMISIASRDAFGGFEFADFSAKKYSSNCSCYGQSSILYFQSKLLIYSRSFMTIISSLNCFLSFSLTYSSPCLWTCS